MSTVINGRDLKTNYSIYLTQVMKGKGILLGKHSKVIALPNINNELRKLGTLKGKIWMSNDFDEPMTNL